MTWSRRSGRRSCTPPCPTGPRCRAGRRPTRSPASRRSVAGPPTSAKVRDDDLGTVFDHDLKSLDVTFTFAAWTTVRPPAAMIIASTPSGRYPCRRCSAPTTSTRPDQGVGGDLPRGLPVRLAGGEGCLPGRTRPRTPRRKVSLSLSDSFCVDRHRADFLQLVAEVDILFANEAEITAPSTRSTRSTPPARRCAATARSPASPGARRARPPSPPTPRTRCRAHPVERIDEIAAGDLYAAGFLYGYTQGMAHDRGGRLGSIAASAGSATPEPAWACRSSSS